MFDWTISVGNILTIVAMVTTIVIAYAKWNAQINSLIGWKSEEIVWKKNYESDNEMRHRQVIEMIQNCQILITRTTALLDAVERRMTRLENQVDRGENRK